MPADAALIESIVRQVVETFGDHRAAERILVLRERAAGPEIRLQDGDNTFRSYHYLDDGRPDTRFDRYVLPRLEIADLVDIAHGKPGSGSAATILELLLTGVQIEVIEFAHHAHELTAPAPLRSLYEGYAETVKGFGLVPFSRPQREAVSRKRVLAEQDIEQFHKNGVARIRVTADCLITPLAEECARKYGIELQRD